MKLFGSLRARLLLSHLLVSLVSIVLLAAYAGRFIFQAAIAEAEHNLQGLAVATGNALELPIQEYNAGHVEAKYIRDLLDRMFSDSPELEFTVFRPDGFPLVDRSETLPPQATRANAPEVIEAFESELGRGISIRRNRLGEQYLYTAVLVQREIEVTAIFRLGVPLAPTLQAAERSLAILLLVAWLIAIGMSLVGWLLANNLSRPIQLLTEASARMERGDLGVRVTPSGPQELQRLAEGFNSMAKRLQANVNELRAFVANASHELRTPLTVVKLRTEALRDGAMEDAEISNKFLEEIEQEVDRLVRMVNDLLDLSRMEAGMEPEEHQPLDLLNIAREVYETFEIRAKNAGLSITCDFAPLTASVMGNEDQIRRVFYNLVENAIRYTPKGGTVEILLREGPKENTVRVLVRDNGPGIPPEHLPHVFERFYRAETNQDRPGQPRGSGLGLAIAKTIVESHGGQIGISSQIGSGTTLWVDLPTLPHS